MQTLDIDRPDMPDLQFVLLVAALCTARLSRFNVPKGLRATIFNRCWSLIDDGPPPTKPEERVLDLRPWTEVTLEAMAETIRSVLTDAGIQTLTWDHPASEATRPSTPAAQPLIERLDQLYPHPPPRVLTAAALFTNSNDWAGLSKENSKWTAKTTRSGS